MYDSNFKKCHAMHRSTEDTTSSSRYMFVNGLLPLTSHNIRPGQAFETIDRNHLGACLDIGLGFRVQAFATSADPEDISGIKVKGP